MGKRKTKTHHLKEKGATSWTTNISAPARNLGKKNLGAVIFGCKNHTINECHAKMLFGLPARHFSYVKNIRPGLPLFLFNYSDRKLHGIYEATSPGQMNIDQYGWTSDFADYTAYGAQVRVKSRVQCLPLSEDDFKPIIDGNYYEAKLFWFELDNAQTDKLISVFTSRTCVSRPLNMGIRQAALPIFDGGRRSNNARAQDSRTVNAPLTNTDMGWEGSLDNFGFIETEKDSLHQKPEPSYSAIVSGSESLLPAKNSIILPERKWSSLFKSSTSKGTTMKDDDSMLKVSEMNFHDSGKEWASSFDVLLPVGENQLFEAQNPSWSCEKYDVENKSLEAHNSVWASENYNVEWGVQAFDASCKAPSGDEEGKHNSLSWLDDDVKWEHPSDVTLTAHDSSWEAPAGSYKGHDDDFTWLEDDVKWEEHPLDVTLPTGHTLCDALTVSDKGQDGSPPCTDGSRANKSWSSSSQTTPHLDRDGQSESLADEAYGEPSQIEEANTEDSYSSAVIEINSVGNHEEESVDPSTVAVVAHWGDNRSSEVVATADTAPPGVQALVIQLMAEVEALKVSYQMISGELVESKAEIRQLKTQCQILESRLLPRIKDDEKTMTDNEPSPVIDDPILIVGGYDGFSWLPDLYSYLPFEDIVQYLAPMSVVRKYSSAVALNGELYVLGGEDGGLWQDTVESYNPETDKWSNRPSLNQKKGSLAGAPLFDKIFAIGGGDGNKCFSDVEMLDLNVGKWIPTRSMAHKRFAPAAAELNGALYVVGGYDGNKYLSSAERFDPREHSWRILESMETKRGCHSLAVLNDKLYALGGHNGAGMVSTVEIYDPRMVSWMMGESMHIPRGYCGAAVLGEKIHVIGGITDNNVILETIEIYKEGRGWETTDMKGVGKRCYFSAIVL